MLSAKFLWLTDLSGYASPFSVVTEIKDVVSTSKEP
jgi:hypothetical protein